MTKSISVSLPHQLGVAEAKRRLNERIDVLRTTYIDKIAHSDLTWTGDCANLRVVALGQTTTGTIDVGAEIIRIEIQLPWLLSALSGKVETLLKSNAKDTLLLGPTPKKV